MMFTDILASLIHDMKNSLGMVINTLDELTASAPADVSEPSKLVILQREAKRLNNNLIELLTLYKIENERVSANIEECHVADFLEELVAENHAIAAARQVNLESRCDDDLVGYFDDGLLRGVINSLIGNGMRYCDGELLLTAAQQDGYLVFSVEDDGAGFPDEMIEAQQALGQTQYLSEGRTQLGIYFAAMVAAMHRDRQKQGFIRLSNGGRLSGGCFSIWLP